MKRERNNVSRIRSSYMDQYDKKQDRQEKRKQHLMRRLFVFALLFIITITVVSFMMLEKNTLLANKEETYHKLKEESALLQEKETQLKSEINRLKDEDYILRVAKTNYFLTDQGEIVFRLQEETQED